jgi:hypothetical protein
MTNQLPSTTDKIIFAAQVTSVLLIWVFVVIITVWVINLIKLSIELNDVPGATVAISIVAIPVFLILASVLTYVFVGLQKEKDRSSTALKEE